MEARKFSASKFAATMTKRVWKKVVWVGYTSVACYLESIRTYPSFHASILPCEQLDMDSSDEFELLASSEQQALMSLSQFWMLFVSRDIEGRPIFYALRFSHEIRDPTRVVRATVRLDYGPEQRSDSCCDSLWRIKEVCMGGIRTAEGR